MKVSVTLREQLTYEITQEFELTKSEYNTYLKTGRLPLNKHKDIEYELSSNVDDSHWIITEHEISNIEMLKK